MDSSEIGILSEEVLGARRSKIEVAKRDAKMIGVEVRNNEQGVKYKDGCEPARLQSAYSLLQRNSETGVSIYR